ncbi:MAG: ATP-binding protein [Ruminococcus sp.]
MNVKISGGIVRKRQKVVIYGPEGVGKSTLAANFPNPLFIDTEGSTGNLNVNRFEDKPTSWTMLINYIEYVKQNPQICDTLVIDTMDWAERLCVEDVLSTHGKKGIEDFGYGNGWVYVAEAIGRFLNLLQELIDKDICNVVLNCHSHLKKFEQPEEAGSYDRYELKLGKKTGSQTAPLVKEWADMILFCNYETYAVAADKDGKKFKAQGGQRVMYTTHHPCWDAKNRAGLPPKLPLEYAQIAHVIEHTAAVSTQPAPAAPVRVTENAPVTQAAQAPVQTAPAPSTPPPAAPVQTESVDLSDFEEVVCEPNIPTDIPQALQDLMRANGVSEEDIRFAVASVGYFPERTPIANYPPDFVYGSIIGAWDQVLAVIKENKKLPF